MKNKISIILTIVFLVIFNSCDDILDKVPLDKPSDATFLQSEDELVYAINAAYRSLWYSWGGVPWEYVVDNCTDIGWDRNSGDLQVVGYGAHSSVTGMFARIWDRHYTGIAKCNNIIENIDRASENASQEVMDQVLGQAQFLRAYWYSQLVVYFGDVPLITNTLGLEENKTPRTSKGEIVDFLLTELDAAAQKLPESWGGSDKGRATKGAALALKSRVALVAGKYDVAAAAAKQVMDSQTYSLFPDYQELFTYEGESCSEVIFEIEYQYGIVDHSMPQRLFSRNAKGHANKIPGQAMIDSYECIDGLPIDESPLYDPANPFENRDPRFTYTIAAPGDIWLGFQFETHDDSIMCWNYTVDPPARQGNQDSTNPYATFSGYNWKKTTTLVDQGSFRSHSSLNNFVIRYGEVLLNYAEAKIELNQIDESCLNAINAIRGRESVQMPAIEPGKSQAKMREQIRRERKIELAMEGLRLQDIRRWGIAHKVMPVPFYGRPNKPYNFADIGIPVIDEDGLPDYSAYADKLGIVQMRFFDQSRDYLWPIPQKEIDVNDQLEQNPGY